MALLGRRDRHRGAAGPAPERLEDVLGESAQELIEVAERAHRVAERLRLGLAVRRAEAPLTGRSASAGRDERDRAVARLAQGLIARAEEVRGDAARASQALARVDREAAVHTSSEPASSPVSEPSSATAEPPPADEAPDRSKGSPDSGSAPAVSAGMRLIVLQLAATGDSREQIARRLGQDFGLDDPDAIVGAVLDRRSR